MAQRHGHAEHVAEVQQAADELAGGSFGPEHAGLTQRGAVGEQHAGQHQAFDRHDLVGGQGGFAGELDGGVGHDPQGEAADGEGDAVQAGEGGRGHPPIRAAALAGSRAAARKQAVPFGRKDNRVYIPLAFASAGSSRTKRARRSGVGTKVFCFFS